MGRFFLLVLILASCSCSHERYHESFKAHMSRNVGKRISDPHTLWIQEDRYVSAHALENGNMEHKYRFRGSCFYFFEVEKDTEVIVSWRFEGSKNDCEIY